MKALLSIGFSDDASIAIHLSYGFKLSEKPCDNHHRTARPLELTAGMTALFKQSGNKGVITLKDELTLPYAEELRDVLIEALEVTDEVSIAMENIQDVDLSCLQTLCSAHRSAVRSQKKMTFDKGLPWIFIDAAEVAGFSRLKGCKLDSENSCLWMSVRGARHE